MQLFVNKSWYILLKSAFFQICNNAGHCHCLNGFRCPRCDKLGPGGSVDSGMGCQNESESINRFNKTTSSFNESKPINRINKTRSSVNASDPINRIIKTTSSVNEGKPTSRINKTTIRANENERINKINETTPTKSVNKSTSCLPFLYAVQ